MWRAYIAAAVLAVPLYPIPASASEMVLKPTLSLSEEYNDNIFGTADGRRTDFITRVQPGANLQYQGPFLKLESSYLFDYRNYARGTHGDEKIHNADLKGSAQFLEDFLFVDLSDSLHRTTTSVARDIATESLLVEQTTQNIASVSPYLLWRLGGKGSLKTGYRYTDTRYFEGVGLDKREQVGFANLNQTVTEKLVLSAGYAFTHAASSPFGYRRHDFSAGFRYGFAERSSLFGNLGNSWNRFPGGISTSDLFWDAGVSHDFGVAVLLLETKVQNVEDPLSVSTREMSYSARLDRAFQRGSLAAGANYQEYYITQSGKLESRRGTISGSGRYEVLPKLSVSGSVYAERFGGIRSADPARFSPASSEYPYRLTTNATASYNFWNNDTLVTLSYTWQLDRKDLEESAGEKQTNRVMLELRSAF